MPLFAFNAPYLRNDLIPLFGSKAWAGGKTGIELSLKFLRQAKKHMKKSSRVLIVESSRGPLEDFKKEAGKMGYDVKEVASVKSFLERIYLFALKMS